MTKKKKVIEECYDYMKANKTSIDSIIKTVLTDGKPVLDILQDAVYRTNKIVIHTYNFLKLYILHLYENNLSIPKIDANFVKIIMSVVSAREHNKGRFPSEATMNVYIPLSDFYDQFYKDTIDVNDIVYDDKLTQMLSYEADDIVKNINTNIKEHYVSHLYKFINIVFDLKDNLFEIRLTGLRKDLAKEERQAIYKEFTIFRNDILNVKKEPLASVEAYHKLINYYKRFIIPQKDTYEENSIHYDVCCHPQDYIKSLIYINRTLENMGSSGVHKKLFNVLPLRTRIIPNYVTFDTTSIISLLMETGNGKAFANVTKVKKDVWRKFFYTNKRVFKKKGYGFDYMIKTDGFACSILFKKIGPNGEPVTIPRGAPKKMNGLKKVIDKQYIENQPNIDKLLCNKNYVVIDPGLSDLIYCMDNNGMGKERNKFRYTQNQRRFETKRKQYNKAIEAINAKTKINGKSVQAIQSEGSENSKTCHFNNFREYLKKKNAINFCLMTQYQKKIYRRLKWYRFINTQRSENKLVNNFKEKFGEPEGTVVIMGDYDNGGHNMRGKEPGPTKRIRKILRTAKYNVYLINEFRTSKLCNKCHCETKTFLKRKSHKPKKNGEIEKVWGILCCTNNQCKPKTKSKKQINKYGSSVYNRDTNAVINMLAIVASLRATGKRPEVFTRGEQIQAS